MTGQNPPFMKGGTYQDIDSQSASSWSYNLDGSGGQSGQTGGGGGQDWIGALIGLGTVIYSSYQQKKMAEQQNAWNRENAEAAYQRDMNFWNMQNQYNSPMSQMQRWRDAGLSPNLIYGGSSSGGNSSSSVKAPIPDVVGVPGILQNLPAMIGQFQDVRLRQAQIDNVKAQTDNVQARTFNESFRGNLLNLQGQYTAGRNLREGTRLNYEKAKWLQRYEFDIEDHDLKMRNLRSMIDQRDTMLPYHKEAAEAGTMLSRVRRDQALKSLGLMDQQVLLNNLRMDAMRKNLQTSSLDQERIIADTILKEYQAMYGVKRGGDKEDKSNDAGVIMSVVRALAGMF